MTFATKAAVGAVVSISMRMLVFSGAVLVATTSSFAQNDAQETMAAGKRFNPDDNQRLRLYQWVETTQVTRNGNAQPSFRQLCRYGPDGQVQRIPIDRVPEPLRATEKMEEEYLGEVKGLIDTYLLPSPHELEQANRAKAVSIHPTGAVENLVFEDYVRPGDQMTLTFDPEIRKITSVSIDTDTGPARDAVTLRVLIASLPDGTSYVQQTVLTTDRMQLATTTTNSRFRILGPATSEPAAARAPARSGP